MGKPGGRQDGREFVNPASVRGGFRESGAFPGVFHKLRMEENGLREEDGIARIRLRQGFGGIYRKKAGISTEVFHRLWKDRREKRGFSTDMREEGRKTHESFGKAVCFLWLRGGACILRGASFNCALTLADLGSCGSIAFLSSQTAPGRTLRGRVLLGGSRPPK
ncbi:MAG: hypothetical protein J6Q17_02910, partial [Clostridia bacterium]|nr:hypothetical protein [Clostridia bacterium]